MLKNVTFFFVHPYPTVPPPRLDPALARTSADSTRRRSKRLKIAIFTQNSRANDGKRVFFSSIHAGFIKFRRKTPVFAKNCSKNQSFRPFYSEKHDFSSSIHANNTVKCTFARCIRFKTPRFASFRRRFGRKPVIFNVWHSFPHCNIAPYRPRPDTRSTTTRTNVHFQLGIEADKAPIHIRRVTASAHHHINIPCPRIALVF